MLHPGNRAVSTLTELKYELFCVGIVNHRDGEIHIPGETDLRPN
jgi:hypothetical protein